MAAVLIIYQQNWAGATSGHPSGSFVYQYIPPSPSIDDHVSKAHQDDNSLLSGLAQIARKAEAEPIS